MRVLVVDNYDSFASNLVQYVGEVVVRRNDAVDVAGVRALDPDAEMVLLARAHERPDDDVQRRATVEAEDTDAPGVRSPPGRLHLVDDLHRPWFGRAGDGAARGDGGDGIGEVVFPGGTITGAPKPRTMEIIDEVEATRRGPYTGSVGVFGFDGRATLNIVIRTLVRQSREYHLRVGAGIVHDSVPEREYEETLDKARALVDAVSEALATRTDLAVEGGSE